MLLYVLQVGLNDGQSFYTANMQQVRTYGAKLATDSCQQSEYYKNKSNILHNLKKCT